ncbi:MAG: diadenylate cyclase CdaA [Verrucomicrobia bacterium]|nr:diadenylate cyclase CdaA [Verrucomicrobiota bacterium]MDE3047546.1 diadenylate cyclase CdaA [Verrucomicrobiota bacterium]
MHVFSSMTPFVEIMIIAIMINYILSFFWNTKSMDLAIGLIAFFLILGISSWLNLPVLHKIMVLAGNVAVIAIIVIFQPELRVALSKLSLKSRRSREITQFDKFLDQLASSVYRMSEKRIGALIVLENEDSLDEYAHKAVMLNSEFSPELLETIFVPTTPLHDGAVIFRDKLIIAAAVILPLIEDSSQLAKSMGTRHRAGLGLSHTTDALVIVVSEETGKVSIAREGIMTRGVKIDRFKGIIRSIFNPPTGSRKPKFSFMEWLRT